MHPGSFTTYHQARADRNAKLAELRRRWDEQRAALRDLVLMYRQKAAYNSDMASPTRPGRRRQFRYGRTYACGSPADAPPSVP
ncbi:putative ABC transporter ATP-binding protein [Mycobacteroides abscessus subsp. abscessus]|nr:putative ABC transporter ATP-binding protein [Mycobacteroides abscessus subsp. abscessus]